MIPNNTTNRLSGIHIGLKIHTQLHVATTPTSANLRVMNIKHNTVPSPNPLLFLFSDISLFLYVRMGQPFGLARGLRDISLFVAERAFICLICFSRLICSFQLKCLKHKSHLGCHMLHNFIHIQIDAVQLNAVVII